MGTELIVNAEAFAKGPAQSFTTQPHEDSLADGIGQSYGVLSYKGKVWSLRYRGQRKNFIRPDDGTPSSYLDVVVLSSAPVKSKSYYADFDPNKDAERPICSSINGLVPDLDVMQKQSDTCALCPRNVWKNLENGRKGRDCTDYKRLAVLLLPPVTKALLGEPLMEPVFLRVPPASLNALAQMGETMEAQGYPYFSYISRITFDPNEAHPKMVFKALQPLTDAEAPLIKELRGNPQTGRIINGDIVLPALAAPVTAPVTQKQESAPSAPSMPAAPQPPISGIPPAAEPVSTGLGIVPPATVASPSTPKQHTAPLPADTGFGGALTQPVVTVPTSPASPPTPAAPSLLADTGAPAETDVDLDSRIAALLKTA